MSKGISSDLLELQDDCDQTLGRIHAITVLLANDCDDETAEPKTGDHIRREVYPMLSDLIMDLKNKIDLALENARKALAS